VWLNVKQQRAAFITFCEYAGRLRVAIGIDGWDPSCRLSGPVRADVRCVRSDTEGVLSRKSMRASTNMRQVEARIADAPWPTGGRRPGVSGGSSDASPCASFRIAIL
jgi:hypothetical protein